MTTDPSNNPAKDAPENTPKDTPKIKVASKNKLAVVIATKDRPQQVRQVLQNLGEQTYHPDQLIVVDGSDNPDPSFVEQFPELNIDYVRVYPPALTKQKNASLTVVRPEITLIGFIDDDIVLEERSLEAMMSFWEDAPEELAGAGLNLTNVYYTKSWLKSLAKRLFFIDDAQYGRILRSGLNTPIWNTASDKRVQWLGGGYTVWRKGVFDRFKFDEWYKGSGLGEDVNFSFHVGKEYQLAVVAGARATHSDHATQSPEEFALGKKQMVAWVYFVNGHQDLSLTMCLWGCVGTMFLNLAKGVSTLNTDLMLRALGNFFGLTAIGFRAITPGRPLTDP